MEKLNEKLKEETEKHKQESKEEYVNEYIVQLEQQVTRNLKDINALEADKPKMQSLVDNIRREQYAKEDK